MPVDVNIDFETRSFCDIRKHGAVVYAEDPTTELLCMSYKIGDDEVRSYDPRYEELPEFMHELGSGKYVVRSWNQSFERAITRHVLGVDPGNLECWMDTMAVARQNGLPGALGDCGMAMRLGDDIVKSETGKVLINYLSKPYRGAFREDEGRLQDMMRYCDQDVVAESTICEYLPPMSERERKIWVLDQKINERGVPIDVENVKLAVEMFRQVKEKNRATLERLCGVSNPGSGPEMKDFFERQGIKLLNLQAATLDKLVRNSDNLPPLVQEMLPFYQAYKRSPITKLQGMLDRTSADGRMRGAMLYHGAGTGRWSSVGINTQNLPRPTVFNVNEMIDLFDVFELDTLCEGAIVCYCDNAPACGHPTGTDPTSFLASSIRGMIKATPGKRFLINDYDQIEARITAWLAQEHTLIDTFLSGRDPYIAQAAVMFHKRYEDVSKEERFLGKIAILALGFGGGVGAFISMATQFGRDDITEAIADPIVKSFRAANPGITKLWTDIEQAALKAVQSKGHVFNVGTHGFLKFRCSPTAPYCLEMRLPSGRTLKYWYPKIGVGKFGGPVLQHEGPDSETRRWMQIEAWYGKLTENAVQAIAADFLREALLDLDTEGYHPVLHVHDEVICEEDEGFGSVEEMSAIMCRERAWFKGFPIAASGEDIARYSK